MPNDPRQTELGKNSRRCCPVCHEAAGTLWFSKADLNLVRCSRCTMVYVTPVLQEYASGQFYEEAGEAYYLSPEKLQSDYAPVRFERELRIFRRFCESGRVLDVGCSTGGFLFQLHNLFPGKYDAWGTDVSSAPLAYAKSKGLRIFNENFLQQGLALGEGSFDAVTFWAVLEHLEDPAAFLHQAKKLLKPGGACFMLVPNLESLAMRFLQERYRYVYPQHLNYFNQQSLTRIVSDFFVPEFITSTHFNPVVLWQDWRRGEPAAVSNAERASLLQRTTRWKTSRLMLPLKWGYSAIEKTLSAAMLADNLVLVCRKRG